MPVSKKRTALEEAEWEDEGEDGAFDRETLLQCKHFPFTNLRSYLTVYVAMETLRVHRPRVLLHGPAGMGQGYVANAVLHNLEGYHTQSLDLGTLMNDSTRVSDNHIPDGGKLIDTRVVKDRRGRNSAVVH
jgi:SpoVK/Ycf46/Vps4 family AAA+-type ATPase